MRTPLDARRSAGLRFAGSEVDSRTFGCPVHPDTTGDGPGRRSLCGPKPERTPASIQADERVARSGRLALAVGFLSALALAVSALVTFPSYRGDFLAVLPWILLAGPLFRVLGRGGPRRGHLPNLAPQPRRLPSG